MKNLFLITSLFFIPFIVFPQEPTKTLDIIYLNNGQIIETRIIRVNNRKVYYYEPKTFELIEIDRDEVKNYEFNDEYFKTNTIGKLEHIEVVRVDGYNKDEIYRAIEDWFIMNSRTYLNGIFLDDKENFILAGKLNTSSYLKADFITVMSAMSNESDVQTYSLTYNLYIRVKDDRFKIYITDFGIQSNLNVYEKLLTKTYEKRKTKEGATTIHSDEINDLKTMLKAQIEEIKGHCVLVRENDTYHNRLVKMALLDDDW